MIRTAAALSLAALLAGAAAFAGPDKKVKVTEVKTCPIMKKPAVKGLAPATLKTKTATYKVGFCCGMCPPAFAKMNAADKEKAVKAVLPKKASAVKAPKLVEVNTCPIMGGSSEGAGGGSSLVGNYKVNFCCGGCKPRFDAMTAAEKEAKIKAALKG